MKKELTNSQIARQNVLNNRYAVDEIQKAIGLKCVCFENEFWLTRSQIATFYEVSERTIMLCTQRNEEELLKNGYAVLRGKILEMFVLSCKEQFAGEVNFTHKIRNLCVYDFRAFLNVGMLLVRSDRAKQIRSLILDVVIDTINQRTGGGTKYINQRDEDFLLSLVSNADYHKSFVDALTEYIDLGRIKYAIYTNKIYKSIFKEDADEYRKVLRLEAQENVRDTMYSEILDLIASYETGYADELKKKYNELGRKLSGKEADEVFMAFTSQALWEPLREKARQKMASRDLCFRDAFHANLQNYIDSVSRDDFDRFIGDRSMSIEERIEGYVEELKRLKNRE